jgi:hypothetical protein
MRQDKILKKLCIKRISLESKALYWCGATLAAGSYLAHLTCAVEDTKYIKGAIIQPYQQKGS